MSKSKKLRTGITFEGKTVSFHRELWQFYQSFSFDKKCLRQNAIHLHNDVLNSYMFDCIWRMLIMKRTKNPHEIKKEKEDTFLIIATLLIVTISLLATFALST